ncbi:hypothetical protein HXX76_009240 [Chlamydomonas incerta]|uniref:Uncharacterized protein n=1 Tax=Chlamydomonas incerta TaxID=51695 RepID=A0A835VZT8_CHLIN|nr:hypothetical protein HXX76_009240 [Chlamydomonas incerta]|eukprot:KAG2431744.1 hypothetical protein HXX76_009240 [Chlamydomonas incerta]
MPSAPSLVASREDVAAIARSIEALQREQKSWHENFQRDQKRQHEELQRERKRQHAEVMQQLRELRLCLVALALAILLLTPVNPSSPLGMVLAAFAKGLKI